MELVLTGSPTTASAMERYGIVNRVVEVGQDVLEEALRVAQIVAAFSAPAIGLAKQAVKAGKPLPHCPGAGDLGSDTKKLRPRR